MSLIHKIHDFFRPYVEKNDDSPLWDEPFSTYILLTNSCSVDVVICDNR